jgi:hypothetical protein
VVQPFPTLCLGFPLSRCKICVLQLSQCLTFSWRSLVKLAMCFSFPPATRQSRWLAGLGTHNAPSSTTCARTPYLHFTPTSTAAATHFLLLPSPPAMASGSVTIPPSEAAAPLNFIYACSVCCYTLADVYEGHNETVQGFSDGVNPKERLVTHLFLGSCCHVFCGSHLEGGGGC